MKKVEKSVKMGKNSLFMNIVMLILKIYTLL